MRFRINTTSHLAAIAMISLLAGRSEAGLLAYYPFDSGFADASGNGNDLTISAGAPAITTTAGEHVFGGGAGSFVSSESDQESLALTSPITFAASDPWTISFWGRRAAGSTNRQGMVIGDLGSSDFIWLTDGGGGVNGMRFRNSGGTSYNNGTSADNAFPDDGNWHHWVLSADGAGNLTVYRDNTSLGTVSAVTTFNATHVGQAFNNNAQSMNGELDELYIFDEALDATDVADLFNGTTETIAPTLAPSDFVDDQGGGTILANTVVTYTVTFSEDITATTVDAADFGNTGAAISIGTITETAPGVFNVQVIPTTPGTLQLELVAGATIFDGWGNALDSTAAILDDTTLTVINDVDPPMTSAFGPMTGATTALPFNNLTLTFNEFVQAGTGDITIHLADGTVVEAIDVNSLGVSIVDDEVTIDPLDDFLPSTAYYVTIDAGAFEDLAGNAFAGITDNSTWAFTTFGSLIAYYPFDTDLADASGFGNDLVIASGAPAITTTAGDHIVGGGAIDMISSESDAEYLALTIPLTFSSVTPWSIAFWGKRAAGSTFRQGMVIGDLGSSDFIWLSDGGGGVSGIRFRNSSGGSTDNAAQPADSFPDDGEWHHWALVADGAGNLTIYRDNLSLGTVAADTAFEATHVGHAFNSNAQSMNGQIDELHIYTEAINAAKVNELFSAGVPATLQITSLTSIGGGAWELTLTGAATTGYEFRSSTTLDFSPGTLVENLTQGDPGDPGTVGGTNDSMVTTDANGDATVQFTIPGSPSSAYLRAAAPE